AQVHWSTAELDHFRAFAGSDAPVGPGLCIDSPPEVKAQSPAPRPGSSDCSARHRERRDATAQEMHPGTLHVMVLQAGERLPTLRRLEGLLQTDIMYAARVRRSSSQSGLRSQGRRKSGYISHSITDSGKVP
ncbi:MAG TPA: hypothetical protein VN835_01325, partial [Steroidobacteraceae bacterium]|nr:hypothetical protein [Steroidobacteraceae bacterium]